MLKNKPKYLSCCAKDFDEDGKLIWMGRTPRYLHLRLDLTAMEIIRLAWMGRPAIGLL
jgi:hypothetical protein